MEQGPNCSVLTCTEPAVAKHVPLTRHGKLRAVPGCSGVETEAQGRGQDGEWPAVGTLAGCTTELIKPSGGSLILGKAGGEGERIAERGPGPSPAENMGVCAHGEICGSKGAKSVR